MGEIKCRDGAIFVLICRFWDSPFYSFGIHLICPSAGSPRFLIAEKVRDAVRQIQKNKQKFGRPLTWGNSQQGNQNSSLCCSVFKLLVNPKSHKRFFREQDKHYLLGCSFFAYSCVWELLVCSQLELTYI